ncbi:MAG: hypothetical protein M3Q65_23685, partial [Chloroflexota bacterium]|nr:hypothetical protein [Chloroflexota bacterium]
ALTLPLAVRDAAALPADALALTFYPTDAAVGIGERAVATEAAGGLAIHGAAGLRALWGHGLVAGEAMDEGAADDGGGGDHEPLPAPAGPLDLARLYDAAGGGLPAGDDGDPLADRPRVCPIIPPGLPVEVGLALLDFAARLGLESDGLRFPLAVPAGAPLPPGTLPLLLALGPDVPDPGGAPPPLDVPDDLPGLAVGEGLCVATTRADGGPALLVRGDMAGVARTLRALAGDWPHPNGWDPGAATVADIGESLVRLAHGEGATGRAAVLAAGLAAFAHSPGAAAGGELRLLDDDPPLRREAEAAIAREGLSLAVTVAPDDRLAFVDEWRDEWEIERARRLVRERVLPALDRAEPVELLVLVSEPPAVRRALAEELAALPLPAGSRVLVLSAFKPGLCWLREVVAPAWAARDDVARVEVRYRPFVVPEETTALDLPIRWLQELYPGDEILAAALRLPPTAVTLAEDDLAAADTYRAVAYGADGRELDARGFSPRHYTRPYLDDFPDRGTVTVTTGAVVARSLRDGRTIAEEALATDLDRFWAHYQGTVLPRLRRFIEEETGGAPTAADQPFFAALDIEVWCSEPDEVLGIREELVSSAEALHEDIYFATLDYVAALGAGAGWSGTLGGPGQAQPAGEPLDAPGAIRPFIHVRSGEGPRARIALRRRLRHLAEVVPAGDGDRLSVAPLPGGPRPRAVVRWALFGTAGVTHLGVSLAEIDGGAAAILRCAAGGGGATGAAPVTGETITLSVTLPGQAAPVALDLPIPAVGYGGGSSTVTDGAVFDSPSSSVLPPPAVMDEAALRPALARLAALPGVTVRDAGRSFEGRPIAAIEVVAPAGEGVWSRRKASLFKPTLLVVARHHANEPASTPAALRLAELCATDPTYRPLLDRVNLVLIPLENPDGAALHLAMAREHPTWKLHAARYNAVGREFARDFFDPETPWGEARVRPALWRRWLPDVVVDNHGVPSH